MESLSNNNVDLKACNVIKKRLQHKCFPVNITKSLRVSIFKSSATGCFCLLSILYKEFVDISYENASFDIQASWSILYKEFVDISCENASFDIQEDSICLQLIYFLTTIAFWPMKYLFWILENCVVFISQISHYGKFMRHCIN